MNSRKALKLIYLNSGIALTSIVAFSPGLWGLEIGGDTLDTSIGITVIVMSLVIFIYGNYSLFALPDNQIILSKELKTVENYIGALKELRFKKTLGPKIDLLLEQIDRISNKAHTIISILQQKFTPAELSFKKFEVTIRKAEAVFYLNLRSILNKMSAFDEQEYVLMTKNQQVFSSKIRNEKLAIYNDYLRFFNSAIEENEEILLKFDKLLLELSNLSTIESGDIEQMVEMRELTSLIENAKLYK